MFEGLTNLPLGADKLWSSLSTENINMSVSKLEYWMSEKWILLTDIFPRNLRWVKKGINCLKTYTRRIMQPIRKISNA